MNQGYKLRPDTIVVAGSARLPENIAAKYVFDYVTVELEIDPIDTKIVDVSCTLVPCLGEEIFRSVLLGNKINEGIRAAIERLDDRVFSTTKRAVIAALEDAYRCYRKAVEEKSDVPPTADQGYAVG